MIELETWKKGWDLLDVRERREALLVLSIAILSSLSTAVMIGSIMPFLAVLAQPEQIHADPTLASIYETFGFASDYDFLVGLGFASLVVILVANLIQLVRAWAVARFAAMRMHSLSHRLLTVYLRQPYEFFLDRHSGALSTQILSESQQVVVQFFRPAADLIASGLTVLAIITLLLWFDTGVALLTLGLLGGIYGTTFALSRRMVSRMGKLRVAANNQRYCIVNESLGGVKYIKLMGREAACVDRYERPSRAQAQYAATVSIVSEVPLYVMQAVAFGGAIVFCLVLLDPAKLASSTALSGILPILGVFAFAGQRLIPELGKIYRALILVQFGGAAVSAIYTDLNGQLAGGTLVRTQPKPLGLSAELRLDEVTYHYPNAAGAGLEQVSFAIKAGEKIGIVGGTGAGKTTLGDVVLGLLRPDSGALVVDGTPIADGNLRAWQRTVGYVPQDIFLSDSSVTENIALGIATGDIDLDRVRRSAKIAQIDDFVRAELPQGYNTLVGERGVRLSGGQKQRLGIARALYFDADLILFDEATSALDNQTEREAVQAIDAMPGNKTILMIAHRVSTLRICDRILVMEKGRIVAMGHWDELMHGNAVFQSMARTADAA